MMQISSAKHISIYYKTFDISVKRMVSNYHVFTNVACKFKLLIYIYIYKRKSQNVCAKAFITQERLYLC